MFFVKGKHFNFIIILLLLTFLLLLSIGAHGKGIDVFGIGLYDFKLDGSETNQATDVKYERRFDIRKSIIIAHFYLGVLI